MPIPLRKNLNFCFTKIKLTVPLSSPHQNQTFNSLYDLTFDRTTSSKSSAPSAADSSDSDFTGVANNSTPDLTTVFASPRFFFSSPGRSNSIIDSPSSSISSVASSSSPSPADVTEPENLLGSSVAVSTYSPDPYMDFRRSMQEMVEACEVIDWDFLQDLLMCYLSLNPKSTHKFILGAFADLLVTLMTHHRR